jgi:hypothetical protein
VLLCKPHHVYASERGDVVASEAGGKHAAASRPAKKSIVCSEKGSSRGRQPGVASVVTEKAEGGGGGSTLRHTWQCIPHTLHVCSKPKKLEKSGSQVVTLLRQRSSSPPKDKNILVAIVCSKRAEKNKF